MIRNLKNKQGKEMDAVKVKCFLSWYIKLVKLFKKFKTF